LTDSNFLTKAKFSKLVEETVRRTRMSYIDTIVHLCELNGIEIEDSRKYVSNVIKTKLEAEAMQLNFLPKQNTLPIED
jgi:hypothetical protein